MRQFSSLGWILALVFLPALPAASAEGHDHAHHAVSVQTQASGAVVKLADAQLLDQRGKAVQLKGDVFGDKIVVINFVYTSCTTVCPMQSAIFSNLQERLGARLGEEVRLVSITVDPLRDTPERLRELAERHHAKPGWTFLTGKKREVDAVLRSFGAYTPDPTSHPAMVMIGSAGNERWTRLFGFPSVDEIQARVEQSIKVAARSSAPAAHHHH